MISIISAVASFFLSVGTFFLGCCIFAASAAATAWCTAFLGSVLSVGIWGKSESRGIDAGVPVGLVLGALLSLWQLFAAGLIMTIVSVFGLCCFVLVLTALSFLFFPPRPLPFGDDGLC